MAHYRKAVGAAAALNTAVFVAEAVAGLKAQSLSLIVDSAHNLSDEIALVFLFLAFVMPLASSSTLQRWANILNSVGLAVVCGLVVWQAFERLIHPVPVFGLIPIVFGFFAAVGNWGVARLLLEPSVRNPAIRLAYLHNMGDVFVSLAPVAAGCLIALTGRFYFDPLVALLVASWILWSTGREVMQSRDQLIWPAQLVCGHGPENKNPSTSPGMAA
jgi:cation diffusion facilitator family transporter